MKTVNFMHRKLVASIWRAVQANVNLFTNSIRENWIRFRNPESPENSGLFTFERP
jgi:hypothetical protein